MLVSIVMFADELSGKICLQTDNTATMTAAMAMKSPTGTMNAIAAEMSLRLDRRRANFHVAEHIPGLLNFIADALGRLGTGAKLPECLDTARRFSAPSRSRESGFLLCWPQDW